MKRLITAFVLFLPLVCIAQIPMGLNYQAIAWDKNNLPKANQTITVTINILKGPNASTDVEFTEIHTAKTNELGLFTLTIGSNNPQGFQQINWAAIPKYLHVIVDGNPSNPTPMLSVPYAMYAENTTLKAGSGIAVNGNTISNTGDGDSDPRNELQELSIEGDRLKLSGDGGAVELSKLTKTSYKILSNGFSFDPITIAADLPGMNITIPEDGIYAVHGSTFLSIPANSDPERVAVILRVGSNKIAILEDEIGEAALSGFFIASFRKNDVIKLTLDVAYFDDPSKGTVYKAYLLVQKIQ